MPRITPINWKKFDNFLLFVGCTFVREEGDHRIYRRSGAPRSLVVPRYNQLPVFIIRNNLRLLGISQQEYLQILQQL